MMRLRWSLSAICGAVVAATTGAVPAQATPSGEPSGINYVNMGDSYSAGVGVLPLVTDSLKAQCGQSENNYAHVIARQQGYHLTDVSCGSATTDDFFTAQNPGLEPQLAALSADTDLVTLTIGGNDESVLGTVLVDCVELGIAAAGLGSPCEARDWAEPETVRTETYPKLVRMLSAVRAKAPNARIAVLNYAWIFPDHDDSCLEFPIAPGDAKFAHSVQAELNDTIEHAADTTGVEFVDVAAATVGHEACEPMGVRWVEPLFTPTLIPAHPNILGERAMAAAIVDSLGL